MAEYCGTSVEMIEKSYGRLIVDDGAAPLLRALGEAKMQTACKRPVGNFGN